MPLSDALIVGEDWISESYFTSDATKESYRARVLERRKDWDDRKEELGASPLSRFAASRSTLTSAFIQSADNLSGADARREAAAQAAEILEDALGFCDAGRASRREGPVTWISPTDVDTVAVAIVHAAPVAQLEDLLSKETGLLVEPMLDENDKAVAASVPRALSMIFADVAGPPFALVLAGRWALVSERTRWAEGRYLAIDLQLVFERNESKRGGEIDSALAAIHSDSFVPKADGSVWWSSTLEDSVKHTVGVSQDLREGIRLSIEIIANEVVDRRASRGLDPLPQDRAQPLAVQSLRFLYRILFLLFAEASPELEVLPVNAADYERGYSLDRLRELVQVPLETPRSQSGTHLYESLATLFRLVDEGHEGHAGANERHDALQFNSLRADLFTADATSFINEVQLGNFALQEVLKKLLLSKEQKGKQRGFISYAELGINQLGAVYEGLMSYTGFFAQEPLYEVAPAGDSSKGSWVLPVSRVGEGDNWLDAHFVRREDAVTGEKHPVQYAQGEFVFRLAGRERQQSASYYTPEVLTRFTVSQALEELLDQNGQRTSAEEVLSMTVCEPALGSGAFAIEAVRQLADAYLARRQEELGEKVDPQQYARELQRVKAYIALHQVYGVDLNSTAVELAEISLWLDTMAPGLDAPWFGLHLRRGNSLVGARRAVYSTAQVADKTWLRAVPRDVPLHGENQVNGGIHHFLLPAAGWGATVDAKEGKERAKESVDRLKSWRRSIVVTPSKQQIESLRRIALRTETLWDLARRRLEIADREIRRAIPLWGRETEAEGVVPRAQIEASLADESGAYRRLRRIMDAWNALWFWPLTEHGPQGVQPPTLDQWIHALQMLVGRQHEVKPKQAAQGQETLAMGSDWTALDSEEKIDLSFAGVAAIGDVLTAHPWLSVCAMVAQEQGFFHWELDFAPIFELGGFDLQVGNPPWVRPRSDVNALLAEGDPWWQLAVKPTQSQITARRTQTLSIDGIRDLVVDGTADVAALAAFVGSPVAYPHLAGLQPDLYRCFMEQTWRHTSGSGTIAMIHPETHFTDEKAGFLRGATYSRLRRHWHFLNERILFEIDDHVAFGVHVYGAERERVSFLHAAYIYAPDVVERSLVHDGSGDEPGLKDPEGNWDLRPHRKRVITVSEETLRTWHAVLENNDVPVQQSRMVYAVNSDVASVLAKLAKAPRIASLGLDFSAGWHETMDRSKGFFDVEWGVPDSWDDVILQGPHLFVSTPMYKSPNETMLHNQDWSATDFETLAPDALPVTAYKPTASREKYDAAYTHWGDRGQIAARDHYRIAWRNMAAPRNERTLIPAIIPPGAAQINGVTALGSAESDGLLLVATQGAMSSLLSDFAIRVAPKSTITAKTAMRVFAVSLSQPLIPELITRTLWLNSVTAAYSDLVKQIAQIAVEKRWPAQAFVTVNSPIAPVAAGWMRESVFRLASHRRAAQVEIDALVAIMLGISADELCTIYRTQFAVLYGYDHDAYRYDVNGRLVPNSVLTVWKKKGDAITLGERTATNQAGNTYVYELPFVTLDREADMRQAYAHFERVMEERS